MNPVKLLYHIPVAF